MGVGDVSEPHVVIQNPRDVTEITMQSHSRRMRRLIASGMLPERAGQPVKVWGHISLAE